MIASEGNKWQSVISDNNDNLWLIQRRKYQSLLIALISPAAPWAISIFCLLHVCYALPTVLVVWKLDNINYWNKETSFRSSDWCLIRTLHNFVIGPRLSLSLSSLTAYHTVFGVGHFWRDRGLASGVQRMSESGALRMSRLLPSRQAARTFAVHRFLRQMHGWSPVPRTR